MLRKVIIHHEVMNGMGMFNGSLDGYCDREKSDAGILHDGAS
jgi:hypothetical protein